MGYRFRSASRGARYVFRGLREGRVSLVALGTLMILVRIMGRRRRGDRVADLPLEPGSSVVLRVSKPGDDPVTFGLDSLDR